MITQYISHNILILVFSSILCVEISFGHLNSHQSRDQNRQSLSFRELAEEARIANINRTLNRFTTNQCLNSSDSVLKYSIETLTDLFLNKISKIESYLNISQVPEIMVAEISPYRCISRNRIVLKLANTINLLSNIVNTHKILIENRLNGIINTIENRSEI